MKKRKRAKLLGTVAVLAILIAAIAAGFYFSTFMAPNSVESEIPVRVYHSYDYAAFLKAVENSGSVRNMASFRRAAKLKKLDETFKPGYYLLEPGLNNKQIERVFSHGWQTPVKLRVKSNIRDLKKMASLLSSQLEAETAQMTEAMNDKQIIEAHGFNSATLLAMFIPDTYEVYWTITPLQLMDRLKKEYDAFWNDSRQAKARQAGLTPVQVMTLASIVIEETKYEPEMPTIAGVYINRLNKGMLLQADPTVKYAVNDPSLKRILNKHLLVDSPYNTYRHPGLPPGPITTPTKAAIDAVLNYQHHNYLYFCADASFNGQHRFAATITEHMANARRFHAAMDARQKAK